jgi:hypothetical protein
VGTHSEALLLLVLSGSKQLEDWHSPLCLKAKAVLEMAPNVTKKFSTNTNHIYKKITLLGTFSLKKLNERLKSLYTESMLRKSQKQNITHNTTSEHLKHDLFHFRVQETIYTSYYRNYYRNYFQDFGSEVLLLVTLQITAFWDAILHSVAEITNIYK